MILTRDEVEKALDKIRPRLMLDGVYIKLVDVDGGTVKVNLIGVWIGCPWCPIIFRVLTERLLKQEMPEVEEVIAV